VHQNFLRPRPTVMVKVELDSGMSATACVPSGASTGAREAVELRDGDAKRCGGLGVLKAVGNVNDIIAPAVKGRSPHQQQDLDKLMCKLDATLTKSNLGANAILGVSMAVCRAAASRSKQMRALLNTIRISGLVVGLRDTGRKEAGVDVNRAVLRDFISSGRRGPPVASTAGSSTGKTAVRQWH
jgi:hypothetical protein